VKFEGNGGFSVWDPRWPILARHLVGDVDHHCEQLLEIDRLGILALHLGVKPARVRDIGDEAVEPASRRAG